MTTKNSDAYLDDKMEISRSLEAVMATVAMIIP